MGKLRNSSPFIFVFCALLFHPEITHADAQYTLLRANSHHYVEICRGADCKKIILPKNEDNSSSYQMVNLASSGNVLIIEESELKGMVNTCPSVYILTAKDKIKHINAVTGESLCNISVRENGIVSSYRNAAKWYDVVYEISSSGNIIKRFMDECVGCDFLVRTEYNPDKSVRNQYMVSDAKDYLDRKILTGIVRNEKAWLYNTPSVEDKTKMYIVKDDVVILKKEQISEDGATWFYLVEYQARNNKKITKWIEADCIEPQIR